MWFAKKSLNIKKIGHAGTLDPLACGVLPLAIGEATKTTRFLVDSTKEYKFTVQWGIATTTADKEGEVIETSDVLPSEKQTIKNLDQFIGEIEQTPPAYSAIKINGKRAYSLARKGIEFEIPKRKIIIYDLKILNFDEHKATFYVQCSKGTYVRTLATDIAKACGTCCHVCFLQRTRVGNFTIENSILLAMEEKPVYNDLLIESLLPIEQVLDDIPVLDLSDIATQKFSCGQKLINDSGLNENDEFVAKNSGKLIAIGQVKDNLLKPVRIFNL